MDLHKYGRNGDTHLVHMTEEEVRALDGLAALAGTSLTVNPVTGYPEAFTLKSLLPTILGVGASMIGGPMLGAAVTGGIEGVRSGDPLRGLAAGALSAGVGSALGGMGTPAAGAADDAVMTGATQAANQALADPSLLAAQTGMALPNAAQAMPPPGLGEQAGNWLQGRVQQVNPGWSADTFMDNLTSGDFSGVSGMSKLGMGLGGLGMGGYWAGDMAKEREAKQEAETEAERQRVQERYDHYADLARRINAGQIAPPTFLPRYPGR